MNNMHSKRRNNPEHIAIQMTGFTELVGLQKMKVEYLVSAGGLYRMTMIDGSFRFFETPNEVTVFILKMAQEHYFIQSFKKDIGKQG